MKLKISLSFFLALLSLAVFSQGRRVSGRVTNEGSTETLAGVTVSIKGGKSSTATDSAGRFSITVPGNNTVLTFTSVGFKSNEVAVGSKTTLDVTLSQEQSTLNDVVVIGYGTARKKDLTGATASMSAATLEKIPLASAAEAMTGRLAGVQVTTTDGSPGNFGVGVRGVRAGTTTSTIATNNYTTSDYTVAATTPFPIADLIPYSKKSTELWQDPLNGNFKIIDASFPGKSNTGDPRWRP